MTTDLTGFVACDCVADCGRVEHCLCPPGLGTWTVKSNAQLREHITATTNKVEADNGFAR